MLTCWGFRLGAGAALQISPHIRLSAGAAGAAGHGAPDGLACARALAPVLHRGARRRAAGHAAGAARSRARLSCAPVPVLAAVPERVAGSTARAYARLRAALTRLFWQRPRGFVAGTAAPARARMSVGPLPWISRVQGLGRPMHAAVAAIRARSHMRAPAHLYCHDPASLGCLVTVLRQIACLSK